MALVATPSAVRVQEGHVIDYTSAGALAVGDVVVASELVGVVCDPATASGQRVGLAVQGVFAFTKVTTGGSAIALGDLVYWDDTANVANETGTNKLIGKCVKAAADADARVWVLMDQ